MHAEHDEVERFATEQGRRIVQSLLGDHFVLRGQAQPVGPGAGGGLVETVRVAGGCG
jgi:hypothetical protein